VTNFRSQLDSVAVSGRSGGLQDYHVKTIGRACTATGKDLAPGSRCHSVLVEKNGELLRFDYSDEGWAEPPAGTIAHWICEVPEAIIASKKMLDPNELMRQFEQLSEEASPAHDKFRYLLAWLLVQRRRLKIDATRVIDDQEFLEVTGTRGEGTFLVRDQQLDESELQDLQTALFGERPNPIVAT